MHYGLLAVLAALAVSNCAATDRRLYELDTGEIVECDRETVTGCGVVLRDCDGGVDYLCEFAVRAVDAEL